MTKPPHHDPKSKVQKKPIVKTAICKPILNPPSANADDFYWHEFILEKYNNKILSVFEKHKSDKDITNFKDIDFYNALKATERFKEVFKELIAKFDSNSYFSQVERAELRKLYKLGYILPLTNKQKNQFQKELKRLKKNIKPDTDSQTKQFLKKAYHLCGGELKEPSIDQAIELLRKLDFELPSSPGNNLKVRTRFKRIPKIKGNRNRFEQFHEKFLVKENRDEYP